MVPRTILILADGAWPQPERVAPLVTDADTVLAANGGWRKARDRGIAVDRVLGDLDSLDEETRRDMDAAGVKVERHPARKDWTDLEIALEHALHAGAKRIHVVGALGGRLDHALANLLLMEKAVRRDADVVLHGPRERVYLVRRHLVLQDVAVRDGVSLLPLSERVEGIRTAGLGYPLVGETLERSAARGVSNEVVRVPVEITVGSGLLWVVHAHGTDTL